MFKITCTYKYKLNQRKTYKQGNTQKKNKGILIHSHTLTLPEIDRKRHSKNYINPQGEKKNINKHKLKIPHNYTHTYTHKAIETNTHTYIHTQSNRNTHTHIHTPAHTHKHNHTDTDKDIHTPKHKYTHKHTHKHKYIQTHIYAQNYIPALSQKTTNTIIHNERTKTHKNVHIKTWQRKHTQEHKSKHIIVHNQVYTKTHTYNDLDR